jgi:rare lipoprotein A
LAKSGEKLAGYGMSYAIQRAQVRASRPLGLMLRVLGLTVLSVSLSACITPRPYAPRANYPIHRQGDGGTGQPSIGDRTLGQYKVGSPYKIDGVWYVPSEQPDYDEVGVASWYGDDFHEKLTANGETFDMNALSAAHKTLPMPSIVEVTNLDNGKKLRVRVNDRGPFVGDRLIDMSHAAAVSLGFGPKGLARVRVRYIGPAKLLAQSDLASAATTSAPVAVAGPTSPSPETLAEENLAPIPLSDLASEQNRGGAVTTTSLPTLSAPPEPAYQAPVVSTGPYTVVVGAFGNLVTAQNLVRQLSGAGQASLIPVERNGQTLYRVVVSALPDEAQAMAVQQRAIGLGLGDARLVGPN